MAGSTATQLGREFRKASLTDATGYLPRPAVKQKVVFLTDFATVELAGGNLDQACASAGEAADSLRRAGYAVGLG